MVAFRPCFLATGWERELPLPRRGFGMELWEVNVDLCESCDDFFDYRKHVKLQICHIRPRVYHVKRMKVLKVGARGIHFRTHENDFNLEAHQNVNVEFRLERVALRLEKPSRTAIIVFLAVDFLRICHPPGLHRCGWRGYDFVNAE